MSIFRRSLAENAVDHYNHTWCFMLLLVLSLVTWLLPLSPYLQPQTESSDHVTFPPGNVQGMQKIKYTAQCWCPSYFTSSLMKYTEVVCGAAFNQAVNGVDGATDHALGASLSYVMSEELPFIARYDNRFKPYPFNTPDKNINKDSDKGSNRRKTAVSLNIISFTSVKTPLILFVFAVCLKLPHIIWKILSGCAGINIDQTLQTANMGKVLSKDGRKQLNQDLVHAVSESAKSTTCSASFLYLFFKLLMCVVAIAALIITNNTLLPEAQNLLKDVATDSTRTSHYDKESNKSSGIMQSEQEYTNLVLICEFPIRRVGNIQHWTVQCVFNSDESLVTNSVLQWASSAQRFSQASTEERKTHFWIYEALYTILLAFFVILTISNVLNLLIWSAKLLLDPCRGWVSSSTNMPVDIYLILYMALENAGHLAACDLEENFSREIGDKKKKEMQTLQEHKM